MKPLSWFAAAVVLALSGAGCARNTISASSETVERAVSPLAGTWTGDAKIAPGNDLKELGNRLEGGPLTGSSTLKLEADGSGFIKVADQAERRITWRQDGDRVLIEARDGGDDRAMQAGRTYIARVAPSGHAMTLDLGDVRVTLTHSG